jgi:hypothetical protein
MCQTLEPQMVMKFLNDLFTRFDRLLEAFDVYKVRGAVLAAVGSWGTGSWHASSTVG